MIQTDGKTYAIKTSGDLDRIMDSLPPLTLAKLSAIIQNVLEPGMEADETRAIMQLSNAAFDAGTRNCGEDFAEMYFDAVIENAQPHPPSREGYNIPAETTALGCSRLY